jgi:formylglycine-generating enzyme required for sulfatase activity
MKKLILMIAATIVSLAYTVADAAVSVQNVKVQQRYPWNGLVDIDYTIVSDNPDADVFVYLVVKDNDLNRTFSPRTLTGAGVNGAAVKPGARRVTWNMAADEPKLHSSALTATVYASTAKPYLVIDLSGGTEAATYPVTYSATPPDLETDECRTTKLWLKFIQPGTFVMGSPTDETGRNNETNRETQHQVTLTNPYYIGVFEITQKQWELVMGNSPSNFKGDTRPVELVSYNTIRGTVNGAAWPNNGQVDASSFLGKLRTKTSIAIDLPTEAQWEYACRAGTTTALNSGKPATDDNVKEVGRVNGNGSDNKGGYVNFPTQVGSYLPNAWGLYDMHGNVFEWCLDWYGEYSSAATADPTGVATGSYRVLRGGAWTFETANCRSANRYAIPSGSDIRAGYGNYNSCFGLRVVALPAFK